MNEPRGCDPREREGGFIHSLIHVDATRRSGINNRAKIRIHDRVCKCAALAQIINLHPPGEKSGDCLGAPRAAAAFADLIAESRGRSEVVDRRGNRR